jgi:DNA repair protein RecN (Recombination protein N)
MIESLHISNYALIDRIDISFHPGFNIITGETGAGKSIMLGALSLLLGGRVDTKAVRDPKVKSVIEAVFGVEEYGALESVCKENEIDWDPCYMILRREIAPGGRSRAFVNDTPVTVALLQQVALHLVDIHSQHQNLSSSNLPAATLRRLATRRNFSAISISNLRMPPWKPVSRTIWSANAR